MRSVIAKALVCSERAQQRINRGGCLDSSCAQRARQNVFTVRLPVSRCGPYLMWSNLVKIPDVKYRLKCRHTLVNFEIRETIILCVIDYECVLIERTKLFGTWKSNAQLEMKFSWTSTYLSCKFLLKAWEIWMGTVATIPTKQFLALLPIVFENN